MTRQCIVRDLSGFNDTTAPMDCVKAMNLAKSGNWGKDWSLEECLESTEGSAPILQVVVYFKNGKFEFMSHDDFFKSTLVL